MGTYRRATLSASVFATKRLLITSDTGGRVICFLPEFVCLLSA